MTNGHLEALAGSTQPLSGGCCRGARKCRSPAAGIFSLRPKSSAIRSACLPWVGDIAQPGQFRQSFGPVPFGFAVDRRESSRGLRSGRQRP